MSVLLLVRHGQASWGEADYDRLSPVGEEQARVLGAALAARGVRPDLVVRGSMLRHRQTADGAVGAAGWDAAVAEDAGWDEFDHMSTLLRRRSTGPRSRARRTTSGCCRFEATIDRWSSGEHDDEYRESFPAFQQRVRGAFDADRGAARAASRPRWCSPPAGRCPGWPRPSPRAALPAWSRLSKVVVNSSVTKVLSGRRGTNLLTFNDHSHLEGGAPGLLTYR